jgi:hypothetical protein
VTDGHLTPDDAEDLAIAAALHEPDAGDDALDDALVAEYEEVLARLAPEHAPPPHLEERVVQAALERRPAPTTSLATWRARREARRPPARGAGVRRLAIVAAAAVVAAVIGVVSVAVTGSDDGPGAGLVGEVSSAELRAALDDPAAETFVLRDARGVERGAAVIAPEGDHHVGFVHELDLPEAPAGTTYWLWLDTPNGPVVIGDLGVRPREAKFTVRGAFDAPFLTIEAGGVEPEEPGRLALDARD